MEDILYTIPEAAELMKTSQGCVHNLRKAGLLRCLKLGAYKVRRAELERFLAVYEGKDLTDPYNVKDLEECSEKVHKTI